MQDLREGTSGVLRSDCIRPDGAISRRALRTIQDGKRLAVFGLRTPITVMQTFPRRGDPGRNSRDCRFALRAALAALASTVTPGARHRRRHLANRAGRSNARTAPAFWARSPRTSTRPLRRSARNARGVVGTDVAYPVDTARSGTQRPSGRPPNRPTGPNSPHIRSAHGCADLTRRASCQPARSRARVVVASMTAGRSGCKPQVVTPAPRSKVRRARRGPRTRGCGAFPRSARPRPRQETTAARCDPRCRSARGFPMACG